MSHPLVELAKSWENFEKTHPNGTAEAFCHFYLENHSMNSAGTGEKMASEPIMGYTNALGVHISRLSKYMSFFARRIMKDLEVDNTEDFYYTATLHFGGRMRKSDLIQKNISEITSGTNVINRLLHKGLMREMPDPEDARSKLVEVTEAGILWMNACLDDMISVNKLTLDILSEEEKKIAMDILEKVDRYHSEHFPHLKHASAKEIKEYYSIKEKG